MDTPLPLRMNQKVKGSWSAVEFDYGRRQCRDGLLVFAFVFVFVFVLRGGV